MPISRLAFPLRFLVACAAWVAAVPCFAISYVPVADTDLADRASLIVEARVVDAAVVDTSRGLATVYSAVPLRVLKGDVPGGTFEVRVAGGMHLDGRGVLIPGLPTFAPGEETLLFLRADGDAFRITHLIQGVFRAASADGERYWQRRTAAGELQVRVKAAPTTGLDLAADRYGTSRNAARFEAWLADRAYGIERAADYFAGEVTPTPTVPLAKFTLIGDNPQLRWFHFDDGDAVLWSRHTGGQAGSADRGTAAFRRARRAWNNEPNTPIRLHPTSSASSTTGFGSSDGLNTILFRDFNNDVDTNYSCFTGGTLALGGPSFIVGGGFRRTWKGEPWAVVVEAEIVVNDGVECFAQAEPRGLEQVYAHELGHTLGLGHACGDEDSPPCAGNPTLDAALMRAFLSPPYTGAELQADDIAGARWLYDADFFDQRPNEGGGCAFDPGHGRYCTDCGPCGNGLGDCDRDSECAAGLVCTDNIGAQFGFAPGVDVCVPDGGPTPPPPPDNCPVPLGSGRYCLDCQPCASGEGDCDNDGECAAGLECVENVGATFGFAPAVDVCLPAPGECTQSTNGRGNFCTLCGPCRSGQGDCDGDDECAAGLACVDDVGPLFGFGAMVDVCL